MSLPVLKYPTYTTILPVSKREVQYRPYLAGEDKILLLSMEADSATEKINLIIQVLNAVTFNALQLHDLPLTDFIYLLLKVKTMSKGEMTTLMVTCFNTISDENGTHRCNFKNEVDVDLSKLEVNSDIIPQGKIQLTDTIGIKLRPPTTKFLVRMLEGEKITQVTDELIMDVVEYIWDEDTIYHAKDHTKEEIIGFIDGFNREQTEKIVGYLNAIPKVIVRFEYTCAKCKHKDVITLSSEDIERFLV